MLANSFIQVHHQTARYGDLCQQLMNYCRSQQISIEITFIGLTTLYDKHDYEHHADHYSNVIITIVRATTWLTVFIIVTLRAAQTSVSAGQVVRTAGAPL